MYFFRISISGVLAENFSILIRVLYSGQFKCVSPVEFKRIVGKFKSQFSGYDQQDSQELLAFLMDGLQEDLNKVWVIVQALSRHVQKCYIVLRTQSVFDKLVINFYNVMSRT